MIDREKVIDELKGMVKVCAMYGDDEAIETLNSAISMLKEQEPRVMTEDDVLHSTGKPLWFESRGMYLGRKGFWCLSFEVDPELHIRFVQSVTGGRLTLSLIDYGKTWRAWDKCPSPDQMRDTPWEGDSDAE